MRLEEKQTTRLGLRWRLFRVLAHLHGLGPACGDVNLPASRSVAFAENDPTIAEILYNYLRATVETLGTGRHPMIDEFGFSIAQLNAAAALAAMHAVRAGATQVNAENLIQGLTEAADVAHAPMRRVPGGDVESLFLFAAGGRS